jgi:diacylglycerol kinase (ATP)
MPPPSQLPPSPPTPTSATPPPPERQYAWQVASNLWVSFRYAGQGLSYAFRTQRNFRLHTFASAMALALGLILRLPAVEVAVLGLTCGAVLTLELINTALEAVVDLTVQQTYHELAKIAKDCAAAAVLVAAIAAICVGCLLLVPPLWTVLF